MSNNTLCSDLNWLFLFAFELRSTYIAVITINIICSLVAVVGNAIMVLAILKNSSLRRTPSFMLLCTLAISDLGVGMICQPLFIALRVAETLDAKELSCKINIVSRSTVVCLVGLSFFTITAISFDRFLALHLKLNYRGFVTIKRVKVAISMMLLASMLWGMTHVFNINIYYKFYDVVIVLPTCLIIAALNYLAIAWKLYGHRAHHHLQNTNVDGTKQSRSFNIGKYKKTLRSILYVYGAFFLCFLPLLCFAISVKSIGPSKTVNALYLVSTTFVFSSSAINPFLYYWRITELRDAIKPSFGFKRTVMRNATPGASKIESNLSDFHQIK